VHRYADGASKLLDGAAFVFAHGVNPEIIVLIEAHGQTPAAAQWKCAFARLGSAELHVLLDKKEIWRRDRTPGMVGQPTDPYWLFFSTSAVAVSE
jgi:hypothetical protein